MRKYGKTDANHTKIVKALRQAGCSVQSLASIGGGCPDLLVCCWPVVLGSTCTNYLFEIKDGSKPPSARRLTQDEKEWQARWRGPVYTVTSVEEALRAVGVVT